MRAATGCSTFSKRSSPRVGSLVDTQLWAASSPVPATDSVAGVVGSGSWTDGSGGALDEGSAACGSDFDLLGIVQRGAAAASSVWCGASLRGGVHGLHGGVRRDPDRRSRPPQRRCMVRRV
jgi:hypothetical protein